MTSESSSPNSTLPYGQLQDQAFTDLLPDKLVVVKIFTRVLVPDVEYKTLSISRTTSCREVIYMLLAKFRLRNRDPNLFFLTIDVWMRKTGIPIRSVMVLDEKTCPAQLQEVYPQQGTKFTLQMRRGELVRVIDDSCFTSSSSPATQPKSILLSDRTTAEELIQLVLQSNDCHESASKFSLFEVSRARNCERRLHRKESPVKIQQEWPNQDLVVFVLRRNPDSMDEDHDEDTLDPRNRPSPWSRVIDENRVSSNFVYKFSPNSDEVSPSGSSDSLSTVRSSLTAASSSSFSSSDYDNFYI